MNTATHMMVQQQVRSYTAHLQTWETQVRRQQTVLEAARMAAHKPNPGHLITSLRSLFAADEMRAKRNVETVLTDRTAAMSHDDPMLHRVLVLLQGHWPQVHRDLMRRTQAERAAAQDIPDAPSDGPSPI